MNDAPRMVESQTRLLGGTEQNWCKAVAGGTGITALALQISKEPNVSVFKKALQKLQSDHPNLNYILYKNGSTASASFIINPHIPLPRLDIMDMTKTSELMRTLMSHGANKTLPPLHLILEHELNINEWSDSTSRLLSVGGSHMWFANVYTLADHKWVLVLRFHAGICDRTTAVSFLKELKELMGEKKGGGYKDEGNMGIEELIPVGKAKKTLWAHGKDMVAYSVNSLRLANLKFKDVKSPRRSEVVRLKMNAQETQMLLAGCKLRGIKLCGALAAASLLAAHSPKRHLISNNHRKKYGVIFLNDCRSYLQPSLSIHEFGFYHSAITTSHEVKGEETLWDLATKIYKAFENSKNNNKHFSDMTDLNFLMAKAIDNPSLTPSSSLRTSLVTVFEDPVIETSSEAEREFGLDDYIGCASAHGVGPSIAIFDTVRDGQLDCACVYPAPLHSREQMQELLSNMKIKLLEGSKMGGKIET